MKKETEVQTEICDYLSGKVFFWRQNNMPVFNKGRFRSMGKYAAHGLPDIFIVHRGMFVALEIKRSGSETEREPNGRKVRAGTLSQAQIQWSKQFVTEGGCYCIVDSLHGAKVVLGHILAGTRPPILNFSRVVQRS